MKTSVYVPSHITGIFNIEEHINPLKKGSCGVGILLDKGVITTVKESSKDKIAIKINGKKDKFNEIIIKETLKLLKITSNLKITQEIQVPVGCGFGTSASSALGVAIAISNSLNLGHDLISSGKIAHNAEINLGSGLGDVIAETSKGLVYRTKAGGPGYGNVLEIKIPDELYVGTKTFDSINTKDIITDSSYKNKINLIGCKLLDKFSLNPNLENFLKYSLEFSKKTNLISSEVLKEVNKLNSDKDILGSSMAMLGNTVFAISENKESLNDLNIYKVDTEGIKID